MDEDSISIFKTIQETMCFYDPCHAAGCGGRFGQGPGYEAALLLAGILLVLAATLWLKKAGGALPFPKESPIQFLPADCSYTMTLSSCLGSLLVLAAAMALGATVAYYLIFVMLAWIFALFVYYTVKMM